MRERIDRMVRDTDFAFGEIRATEGSERERIRRALDKFTPRIFPTYHQMSRVSTFTYVDPGGSQNFNFQLDITAYMSTDTQKPMAAALFKYWAGPGNFGTTNLIPLCKGDTDIDGYTKINWDGVTIDDPSAFQSFTPVQYASTQKGAINGFPNEGRHTTCGNAMREKFTGTGGCHEHVSFPVVALIVLLAILIVYMMSK
jgi:hypothetical protein